MDADDTRLKDGQDYTLDHYEGDMVVTVLRDGDSFSLELSDADRTATYPIPAELADSLTADWW